MKKKMLAVLMTAIMALSAVPVFAEAPTHAGEIIGEPIIVIVPHVFEMTLPTQGFDFLVDPEGVIGSNAAGAINFRNASPVILNQGSSEMRLGVELTITTADSGDTQVIPVTAAANINGEGTVDDCTNRNVFVQVGSSTANVPAAEPAPSFDGAPRAHLLATPRFLDFVLPGDNWDVEEYPANSDNFRRVRAGDHTVQGTQLNFTGQVNPAADWTGDEEFGIRVRFSFTNVIPANMPADTEIANALHLRRVVDTALFTTMELPDDDNGVNADFTVDATGAINADAWSGAEPLTIQFTHAAASTTLESAVLVATSEALLLSNPWPTTHNNGTWSYDPTTGLFTIGRMPGAPTNVLLVRVGDVTVTINITR